MPKASSFMLRVFDAHRLGGDLVLADRHPGAADAERSRRWQITTLMTTSARNR